MNLGTWLIEEEQGDTCKETRFFSERRALAFIHQCLPSTSLCPGNTEMNGEVSFMGWVRQMISEGWPVAARVSVW